MTTQDHYSTLGVPTDATPTEIKQAWRRLSSEHHPDRPGGDPERMAAVNRAFEILGTPEKRAEYDRTGNDGSGDQLQNAAEEALRGIFTEAIDKQAEPVAYALQHLKRKDGELAKFLADAAVAEKKLRAMKGKTTTKRARNLVENLLDERIASLQTHVTMMKVAQTVQARAYEVLADYAASETDEARKERERVEAQARQASAMQHAFGLPFGGYGYQTGA